QVPSIPIICAGMPRSKVTRSPLLRSLLAMLFCSKRPNGRSRLGRPQTWRGGLTAGKFGLDRGIMRNLRLGWRRNMGRIPSLHRLEFRMRQRAGEIGPDARLVFQILRFAVAAVEPREGAEQPRVALGRHDGIERGEAGRIEIHVSFAP